MKDERNERINAEADLRKALLEALVRAGKDVRIDEDGRIVVRRARRGKRAHC